MNGLNIDALIIGLMSAIAVTFWLATVDTVSKAASAVFFSALLSSFGAPVASAYLVGKFPTLQDTSDSLILLLSAMIGGSVTWGLPILINFVKTKWGNKNA